MREEQEYDLIDFLRRKLKIKVRDISTGLLDPPKIEVSIFIDEQIIDKDWIVIDK